MGVWDVYFEDHVNALVANIFGAFLDMLDVVYE